MLPAPHRLMTRLLVKGEMPEDADPRCKSLIEDGLELRPVYGGVQVDGMITGRFANYRDFLCACARLLSVADQVLKTELLEFLPEAADAVHLYAHRLWLAQEQS